jgi:5,6-dimethylbenzimidazole synthase
MTFGPEYEALLRDVLRWRRDERHFKRQAVDPAVLARVEAAVDLTPSVGNSRPWRMVRVNDAVRRAKIADLFEAENAKAAAGYDDERQQAYMALKLAGLREAPEHLAVFTHRDPYEGAGLGRQTMPEMLSYSTVVAIHTYWLAATACNLGVGWVSILDPASVSACLDVPAEWQFTAYLCVGYAVEPHDLPELHRAGWQANTPTVWLDR